MKRFELSHSPLRLFLFATTALCAVAAAACDDPDGALSDFETRQKADENHATSTSSTTGGGTGGQGGGSGCKIPQPGDINDDYFLSLSVYVAPTKPAVLLAHTKSVSVNGGPGFSMVLQPLKVSDRKTPTGGKITINPTKINADGTFTISAGTITVPGDANPVTPGQDIVANVTLTGSFCQTDFVCGDATGMVSKPLPLNLSSGNGSHWTMQKITDPNKYPAPLIDCAKDPAM
jgi:hypothetical protein